MSEDGHLRVSDQDRDEAVERLRTHLLAGRLDPDEHEERVAEACHATYGRDLEHALRELPGPEAPAGPAAPARLGALAPAPPAFVQATGDSRPGGSLALGISAVGVLIFTIGLAAIVALPLSILAWILGAQSGGRPGGELSTGGRATAQAGMWLGIVGTFASVLAMSGWGLIFL